MPRDGYPCACYSEWYGSAKCAHHAERDELEAERGESGPREVDYSNAAAYFRAYRAWCGVGSEAPCR